MAYFIEQLATQQLWHWLETEREWTVDSEVDTGNGRIDLACETPDGRYIGIELKAGAGLGFGSRVAEQLWRYVDSGVFDEIYFASPSTESIQSHLEADTTPPQISIVNQASLKLNAGIQDGRYSVDEVISKVEQELDQDVLEFEVSGGRRTVREYIKRNLERKQRNSRGSVDLERGIRQLSRAVLPPELGIIEIDLPLEGGYMRSPRMALTPGETHPPNIVREAGAIERTSEPNFSRREEPWIRHAVWEHFGGLPEGSVPNVMESERLDRPTDLIAFESKWDPAEILDTGDGAVIAVEAKGEGSFSPSRVKSQLTEVIATKSISRLYLAVPQTITDRAANLVIDSDELTPVGVLAIDESGHIERVREAETLTLEHDGYKHGSELYRTGYGDVRIPGDWEVNSPFVLSEWRDPLTDDAGEPVVWDFDPLDTDYVIQSVEELEFTEEPELRPSLKSQSNGASTDQAYLLTGYSAAPFVKGEKDRREPKYGYVRLSVCDFQTEEDEYAIELHFGAGSWEGGYVAFVDEQVDALISVLSSLENIDYAAVPGQGQYIDLEEFRWEYGENYEFKLGHEDNPEKLLSLSVEAAQTDDGTGAVLSIGDSITSGVEVTMTQTQRVDFLRALRVMRYGRPSELPGEGGYQRVGPDGDDTWDKGTEVEKSHNPEDLPEPDIPDSNESVTEEQTETRHPTNEDVLSQLQAMNPITFEHLVADVWNRLGWSTNVVGQAGDRGIDIVARAEESTQLIQAKRYGPNTTVGSPEIQQYASLRIQEEGVDQVTVVTSGTFSRQASEMAPDLEVILVDGESFVEIINEVDAWDIIANYFDEFDLASEAVESLDEEEEEGLLGRIKSWF
jgi:hypothetical protein